MKKVMLLVAITALSFAVKPASAQTAKYSLSVDSVKAAGTDSAAFKVVLKNTGTDTIAMVSLSAQIGFSFGRIANKGALTAGYKTGTATSTLPTNQKSPSIIFNASTLDVTITVPSTDRGHALKINPAASVTIGWFYLKNTVAYDSTQANFIWEFPGTQLLVYKNSQLTPTNLTSPIYHFVQQNTYLKP